MNSNSNFMITDFKVDPTSQQISEIYINGEKLETGNAKLMDLEEEWRVQDYGTEIKLTNERIKELGYDGLSSLDITLTDILPESVTVDDITVSVGELPNTVTKPITIRDEEGNVLYETSLKINLIHQVG